jgi:acetoacetate decarboxylase
MSFVRTEEELAAIESRQATNEFREMRTLTVRFRTDPAFAERVLPPGLTPTEPVMEVEVSEVGASNCVGPFAGGGLYLRAAHEGREGSYCLAMPMTTDAAVTWGRELFGEPKKLAAVDLERDGDDVTGTVDRRGERVITLTGEVTEERSVDTATETVFHYKYLPDAAGDGLQFDPLLVAAEFDSEVERLRTGTGTVEFESTPHDPYGEVPVVESLGAAYSEADTVSNQEVLTTVDSEAFRPYAYATGAVDDPLAYE